MAGNGGLDPVLAGIWDLLVMATSFQHWPDGDPAAWRELGDTWLELSDAVTEAFDDMNASATNVALAWGGDAGEAFISRWSQFTSSDASGPAAFSIAAYDYYDACYSGALQLEYSQLMCEIILAITAIEVAIGLAFPEFGGDAFAAGAIALGRVALRDILEKLATALGRQILKQMLKQAMKLAAKQAFKGAVKGALTFALADLLAQQIQVGEGYRDQINWASVGTSAVSGAAAGAAGVLFGKLFNVGGRLLTPEAESWLGRIARPMLRGAAKWSYGTAGHLLNAGLVNIPTMAVMDLTQNAVVNHKFGFSDGYLAQFKKNGVVGELWHQFAAGAFAAGVHVAITEPVKGLREAAGRYVGGKIALGSADLTRDGWLAEANGLSGTRADGLVNSSTALTEADTYRQLEIRARQEANSLTGTDRTAALNEAHRYEGLANQADQRAATALKDVHAPVDPATPVTSTPVVDRTGGQSGGVRTSDTRTTDTATTTNVEPVRTERKQAVLSASAENTGHAEPPIGENAGPPAQTTVDASHEPSPASVRSQGGGSTTSVLDRGPSTGTGSGDEGRATASADLVQSGGPGSGSHLVPPEPGSRDGDRTTFRSPESVPEALAGLREAHQNYVVSDLQASHARQELEQARQTNTGLDLGSLRRGVLDAPRHPDLADHEVDKDLWGDLATAGRTDVLGRLDDLLSRPDLPESMRPQLEGMRDAYRGADHAHTAADLESAQVGRDRATALDAHTRGDHGAAQTASRDSGEAAGREAKQRIDARRSLAKAEESLRRAEADEAAKQPAPRIDRRGNGDGASGGSIRVPEQRTAHPTETGAKDSGTHDQHTTGSATSGNHERTPVTSHDGPPSRSEVPHQGGASHEPGFSQEHDHSTGGSSLPIQEELRLSDRFGTRFRTGADLPSDVRTMVDEAKQRLLNKYPERTVRTRLADLDAVARHADRLDALVEQTRGGGSMHDLVGGVRDLSRAVNDYSDRYRNWRDFGGSGDLADPGWKDLHGVDPLDAVELAHRNVSIDPRTMGFHPLEKAMAIAKIADILGPEFGDHASQVFERMVPKDPEAARRVIPPELFTPELEHWLADPSAHGGFDPRTGHVYVEPGAITAVAATAVHEGMHAVEPNAENLRTTIQRAVAADPRLSPAERREIVQKTMARLTFENEHRAFTVEQHFLRGLTGHDPESGYESDLRIPAERRQLAAESPEQMQETTLRKYIDGKSRFGGVTAEELLGSRDPVGERPDLGNVAHMLDQARTAIADALYHDRRNGFVGPYTAEAAERWHVDLGTLPGHDTGPGHLGTADTGHISEEQRRGEPEHPEREEDNGPAYRPGSIRDALNAGGGTHPPAEPVHGGAAPGERHGGLDFRTADEPLEQGMPAHPNDVFGELHERATVIAAQQLHLAESLGGDGKYWFAKVYHHVTTHELAMIDEGRYTYPIMKMQEVEAFHETYRQNMDAWLSGRRDQVEPNWRRAFEAAEAAGSHWRPLPSLHIMDALLPSMQAHIRFDLPRAIASAYEHRYASSGIPFDAFKPDFDRMQPVFDEASAALRPEIATRTFLADPGQYGFVQDHGFRFIFDVPRERLHSWEKADWIVSGHREGITDQAGMQRRLAGYSKAFHPLTGRSDLRIGGSRIDTYDWNHQPGDNTVTASIVPGGEFNGLGVHPSLDHRAELLHSIPDAMERAVGGQDGLTLHRIDSTRFEVQLPDGGSFTVRVETQWHGFDAAAVSRLNHDKGQHVIQLSDQLPTGHVERALAHEIGEIVDDRSRYLRGEPSSPPDALAPGDLPADARLSPHDAGRVQELRTVGRDLADLPDAGHRTPQEQQRYDQLHRQALALVDHLGMRDGSPDAPARRAMVFDRVGGDARDHVRHLLDDAGRAEHDMSPEDRGVLDGIRERAAIEQARLDDWHSALAPGFDRPLAPGHGPVTPEQARELADRATAARTAKSDATLHDLRAQAEALKPEGRYPSVKLQLGGGASLSGRDPHALLVDLRGRWQSDNGTRIAQTADQLRDLNRTGIGDPYQFAGPGDRVPLDGVRFWEDSIAAQGLVIDGEAVLRIDGATGALLVDIEPSAGGDTLTLAIDGTPMISSGFPPEAVLGVDRAIGGVHGTFAELHSRLRDLGNPSAIAASRDIAALSWNDVASATKAIDILHSHGLSTGDLGSRTRTSLEAVKNWHDARLGDRDHVLTGDEANLHGDNRDTVKHWVMAGTGGTGISGIENLLMRGDARFTMVGTRPPPGLGENTQWKEVRAEHDLGYDPTDSAGASKRLPDGTWPNPAATGRLSMVFERQITGFTQIPQADGTFRYTVDGIEGDGVIVSIGGRPGIPPAVAEMVDSVLKEDPGAISGDMLFDHNGQYLGYRLTVGDHVVDVTGATSRFFPGDPVFPARIGRAYDHPASWQDHHEVWTTQDHRHVLVTREDPSAPDSTPQTSASRRDAPPESGNFDGGYVATAVQVSHYVAAVRGGEITASHVPDSRFHGHGLRTADPTAVAAAGDHALHDLLGRQPAESPIHRLNLTVEPVPAHTLPDRAVARSVPVDEHGRDLPPGTVPPEGGGYRIEVSDRATDINVGRAMAHEVAELTAIGERAGDGLDLSVPDALHQGDFTDGAELSPHDRGRLAEAEFLNRLADHPEHGAYARSELAALRDHLGLRADTPGADGRWHAVGDHLSPEARHTISELGNPPIAVDAHFVADLTHAIARADLPLGDTDIQVVRLADGSHALRIFSDDAFLQSARQWRPGMPGADGDRPFSLDGALPEVLALDAVPGLRDLAGGDWAGPGTGHPLHVEVYPAADAHAHRDGSADGHWLHTRSDHDPAAGAAGPHTGPGDVPLHVDDHGQVRPADRSGHVVQDHEIQFIGEDQPVTPFDQAAIDRWMRREAPLGMPTDRWSEWKSSLRDALAADGVDPDTVDIRMKGSSAEFFSGRHKSLPTWESLDNDLHAGRIDQEAHDRVAAVLSDWESKGHGLPQARPFDSMYRLGLDPERSDYDLNFSSDTMFRRALAGWDVEEYGRTNPDGSPRVPVPAGNHGYLTKSVVSDEFSHLNAWAERWSGELGREMSYAVFLSRGPDDTTVRPGHNGISVHQRDTDWIIQRAAE